MRSPVSLELACSAALATLCAVGTAHAAPSQASPHEYAQHQGIQMYVDALLQDENFAALEPMAKE